MTINMYYQCIRKNGYVVCGIENGLSQPISQETKTNIEDDDLLVTRILIKLLLQTFIPDDSAPNTSNPHKNEKVNELTVNSITVCETTT